MKLIEINWNPTHRQLRQFAIICLFALPFLGWLWGATAQATGALALVGLAGLCVGMLCPQVLKPIFIALSCLAAPLGLIVSELSLLALFFGLFLPIGLVFRLIRRDALQLTCNDSATTYWQAKKQPTDVASYYRQF